MIKWLHDESEELVALLKEHGYDHTEFLDALSDTIGTKVLAGMNDFLCTSGDKRLRVANVKTTKDVYYEWEFIDTAQMKPTTYEFSHEERG